MKPYILSLIPLSLAVVATPATRGEDSPTPPTNVAAPAQATLESTPMPDLRHSAIAAMLDANCDRVPRSGTELNAALEVLGDFVQLSYPFSAVALDSGLTHPRVVITIKKSPTREVIPFTPPGGWISRDLLVNSPIPKLDACQPNLEGRLFLAANMEAAAGGGNSRVKTVEFISWNSKRLKFDFGVIEDLSEAPRVRLVDGVRCFSCHKNRGPILGVGPWSNSVHNDRIRGVSKGLFQSVTSPDDRIDGMALTQTQGPEVEEGVRLGASMLRDREVIRVLTRTHQGKGALLVMLQSLVENDRLDAISTRTSRRINGINLMTFLRQSIAVQKTIPSNFLADFSPAGSIGRLNRSSIEWSGSEEGILSYDSLRAHGEVRLPPAAVPSNPRAFLIPPPPTSARASDHIDVARLARAIGLTEGDRTFLIERLEESVQGRRPHVTEGALARQIFSGLEFEDVIRGELIPDRESYTTTPKIDRSAIEEEREAVPTHSCLRCHEVRLPGSGAAFSPIPQLAFDPFNPSARDQWLRTADRRQRVAVLGRLYTRLATDKDMPPEDSAEAELYRGKNPAAFAEVAAWLEIELKRARGR